MTNLIKRCPTCRGQKIVMGMGGLEHKCKPCAGIGHVERIDDADTDKLLADSANSKGVSPKTIYKSRKKSLKVVLAD